MSSSSSSSSSSSNIHDFNTEEEDIFPNFHYENISERISDYTNLPLDLTKYTLTFNYCIENMPQMIPNFFAKEVFKNLEKYIWIERVNLAELDSYIQRMRTKMTNGFVEILKGIEDNFVREQSNIDERDTRGLDEMFKRNIQKGAQSFMRFLRDSTNYVAIYEDKPDKRKEIEEIIFYAINTIFFRCKESYGLIYREYISSRQTPDESSSSSSAKKIRGLDE